MDITIGASLDFAEYRSALVAASDSLVLEDARLGVDIYVCDGGRTM